MEKEKRRNTKIGKNIHTLKCESRESKRLSEREKERKQQKRVRERKGESEL